jgi:small subunit ribosomal protein S5
MPATSDTTTSPNTKQSKDAQTTRTSDNNTASSAGANKKQSGNTQPNNRSGGGKQAGGKRDRRRQGRGERAQPEYDHSVIDIRRVTRVMAGGRRFSFRVTLVAGNRRGRVGVGVGKATDTPLAIEKAFRDAKRNMIDVNMTAQSSIPCEVEAKYCGSRVLVLPSPGRGVIAGSSVRPVIELAGLNDVTTKLVSRSKNKLNNAKVAIAALSKLPEPKGDDAPKAEAKQSSATNEQTEAEAQS